ITCVGSKKFKNRLQYCSVNVDYLETLALKNYSVHTDKIYRYNMENYLISIKDLEPSLEDWVLNMCNNNLVFNWNILNNRYLLTASNKLKFSSLLIAIVIYLLIYIYMYYNGITV